MIATPGAALALQFAKRFWPLFVILPLAFTILIMRNTITGKAAKLEAAETANAGLNEANRTLQSNLDTLKQARVDNDAIADAVVTKIKSNNVRLTETRTVIEKAMRDEPNVRDWGAVPVPSRVREALRPGQVHPAPR